MTDLPLRCEVLACSSVMFTHSGSAGTYQIERSKDKISLHRELLQHRLITMSAACHVDRACHTKVKTDINRHSNKLFFKVIHYVLS